MYISLDMKLLLHHIHFYSRHNHYYYVHHFQQQKQYQIVLVLFSTTTTTTNKTKTKTKTKTTKKSPIPLTPKLPETTIRTAKLYTSFLQNIPSNSTNDDNKKSTNLIDYTNGWAWQNLLLQQRFDIRRRLCNEIEIQQHQGQQQNDSETKSTGVETNEPINNNSSSNNYIDNNNDRLLDEDIVLVMEHYPVYTLGRGANEKYLSFLSSSSSNNNNNNTTTNDDDDNITTKTTTNTTTNTTGLLEKMDHQQQQQQQRKQHEQDQEQILYKLSRKNRGPGTARLCFEPYRTILQQEQEQQQQQQQQLLQQQGQNFSNNDTTTHNNNINIIQSIVKQLFPYANYHKIPTSENEQNQKQEQQQEHDNKQIQLIQPCGIVPVIAPNNTPIYRVERGGEVTFHGPGQLVIYPIIDLSASSTSSLSSSTNQQQQQFQRQQDLHWYVRTLEQIIIDTLLEYNIIGYRDTINTGVWVTEEFDDNDDEQNHNNSNTNNTIIIHRNKIAAIGVSANRWITTHGFALNVCPDLQYFNTSNIIPCGINNKHSHNVTVDDDDDVLLSSRATATSSTTQPIVQYGVTSIERILQKRHGQQQKPVPTTYEVSEVLLHHLQHHLGVRIDLNKRNFIQ